MNSIKDIVNLFEKNGFSTDNIVFGSGGKFFLSLIYSLFTMSLFCYG